MAKAKAETIDYAKLTGELDGSGFEDATLDTMAVPFLKLLQALSPQLKKSKPEYIEGASEGDIINSITGKNYGRSIRIVVGKFEHMFLEWDIDKRGKLKGVHTPESVNLRTDLVRDEKNRLVDLNTNSQFSETYTYYVIMPDHLEDGVCIISLSSTALKEGKKLNRMLFNTVIPGTKTKALPFLMIFNVNVVEMSNDSGDWSGLAFTLDQFVSQDVLDCVVEERKQLPNKTVDYSQSSDTPLLTEEEHF